jgi:hypothetical protein
MRRLLVCMLCVATTALAGSPDAFGRFEAWAVRYRAEPSAVAVAEGVILAQARRAALLELTHRDPAAALRRQTSAVGLPGSVAEWVEKSVDGRADVEVLCEYPTRTVRYVTLGKTRYPLLAYGKWLGARSGVHVVRGFIAGDDALLDDSAVAPRSELPSPWTVGNKRLLYVRVDFSDDVGEPISVQSAQNVITQVDQFMRANSFDKTRITGTVVPMVLRLPRPKAMYGSSNNTSGLLSDARAAARMAGFDPATYDLDVVAFRRISAFSWAGLGRVGGAGTWINGSFGLGTLAHELGHNFGLPHANFWQAGGETIIGAGNEQEYGNPFDTMGGGAGTGHFGAWYKSEFLDWLEPAQVAKVTVSNTYRIADLEQPSVGQQQALEVPISAVRSYWVEYRPASGGLLARGAVVTWGGRSVDNSVLLDMQPQTAGAGDAVLPIGRTFSDASGGIHITPTGVNGASLDVTVNRGVFASNRNPNVTLMSSSASPAPGQALTFTAMASDPDGDALAYFWEVSGDSTPSTNTASVMRTIAVAREVLVRVVVSDMKGGVASANLPLTVGSVATVRITGRVTEMGQGVEGARITAGMRSTVTDSSGAYTIVGVLAGPVTVSAVRPGFTLSPTFTNPVMVGAAGSQNIDFTASRAGFGIFGRVTSVGMPLAGATVSAGPYSSITNGLGDYELRNIPNGQYNLTVSAPGAGSFEPAGFMNPVVVNGVAVTGRNFIERAQSVAGVVNGEPGPHVVSDGSRSVMTALQSGQWRFTLPRVPFGTYHVVATAAGQRIVPMFANPVSVSAAAPAMLVFNATLGAVYTVSGRVTELGAGLSDTTVRLTNAATTAALTVVTDSDGRFAFPNQEDGTYTLAPARSGYTFGPASLPVTVAGAAVPNQDFIVQGANARPVIVVRPSASPVPVVGSMADLTVLADDPAPGSEGDLIYTWVQTFGPGLSMFGRNADNGAKSTPVTFPRAGAYGYKVTVTDPGMLSVAAELTVVVPQTPTTARVTSNASSPLTLGETRQFVVAVVDQFGQPIETAGDVEWSIDGRCGTVSAFGRFTATSAGACAVVASVAGLRGSAMVTVQVSRIPRIVGEPTVMPSPVAGSSATATVVADDDMGESNLTYTWSALNPPSAVTFAVNGSNAAKSTAVRFTAPGMYRLQVDVRDQQGNETQGFTAAVTVTNGLAALVVTASAASVPPKGTTRITARGADFMGMTVMVADCMYSTTAGSIDMSGTFTAPEGAGMATISVTCNGITGSTPVSWSADAPRGCGCSSAEGGLVLAVGLLGTVRKSRRRQRRAGSWGAGVSVALAVAVFGCSGTPQPAPQSFTSQAQAVGEVVNGYPSDQERMLHVLINQARVGGQSSCDDDAGTAERRAPLVFTREANTSARFSSRHMAENGCFQNENCCALGDAGMGLGCVGQGACSGMACGRTCDAGVGQTAANRFVAAGFSSYLTSAISRGVPSAQTLYCRFLTNDGIRGQMRADAGTEFSAGVFQNASIACTEPYWTIAYGSALQNDIPRIPVGSVMHAAGVPPTNATELYFAASYYDPAAVSPRRAAVVVAGHCFDMDRRWGYDDNGTYESRFSDPDVVPAGCHPYYFLFTDSAGARHTYPSAGSLQVAVGTDQSCPLAYDPAPQMAADCETGEMQCPAGASRRCYTGDMANLGIGECRQGIQRCRNGFWGACRDQISPFAESCDGLDNDCDGQVDEGNPGGGASCTIASELGACQSGTRQCTSGRLSCVPTTQPAPEVCDGIDNDCDGAIDDGFGQAACGVGECFRLVNACEQGRPVACDGGVGSPEVADGKDNDCNGLTDDGLSCLQLDGGFGQTRTFWPIPGTPLVGRCMQGLQNCQEDGGWAQTRAPVLPGVETCNGVDDDCNGIEERDRSVQLLLGYERCGVGACTIRTSSRCISGRVSTCMPDPMSTEMCDGLDNNCDGTIDEMCSCRAGDTRPCYTGASETRGVGLCRAGLRTCVNGKMTACLTADAGAGPDAGEVRPAPEVCNGLDDDCDGVVDDACLFEDGGVPGTGGAGGSAGMGGAGGETPRPGGCGCNGTELGLGLSLLAVRFSRRKRLQPAPSSPRHP